MKKMLIVDGNSILNRAFYGVRPLTTRDGRNTNAIFGFINMLYKQLEQIKPDYAAMAFDLRSPTFRHKACSYYKANRKGMPEELAEQLEPAKNIASLMGFHLLTLEGYEADDILGTLSKLSDADTKAYIMTGDRDSYQLITDTACVLYVSTKETSVVDAEKIAELYGGITPGQLIDVKALMGDTSDNIPGVPGIGEKTAVGLIAKYGSLDGVYKALEENDPQIKGANRTKLESGKDSAYESRFLAEICCNAPVGATLESLSYTGINSPELFKVCTDLELKSIITRLNLDKLSHQGETAKSAEDGNDGVTAEISGKTEFECIECKDAVKLSEVCACGTLFVYADKDGGKVYCVSAENDNAFALELSEHTLRDIFENENIKTVVHDLKNICMICAPCGVNVNNCEFDVLLGSYVADPSKVIGSDSLCSYAGIPGADVSDPRQKGILCALAVKKAYNELLPVIKENGQEKLLYEIEMPLSHVLAQMELTGFKLNAKELSAFSEKLEKRLEKRRQNIYALAGGEFNINSTKQLAEVLYERLGLPALKKTKSGYSTDAETLEKLRPYSEIIDEILEYRLVAKLKSTYTDPLIDTADENGRIHTSFKQAFTLTGRLSSAEPNLQNIPIKTEEGRELRKFFEAENHEYTLIDADYSQIELRLMAAMSGDENMINTFKSGADIHTSTAAQVFDVEPEDVTPELRKRAKAVNFGIIYGISDFSLAGDLHVTKNQAGDYIRSYFAKYPKIKKYLDGAIESAKEKGYSETLYGRRRYIPELTAKNKNLRSFGERVAMNAPIQGTAADIIKIAMIETAKRLEKESPKSRLVLQVHDELIVEAPVNEREKVEKILVEAMESAASLPVKLEVQAGNGFTWYDAHS